MTVRSVSYGGGVQSTALLVLAAERVIDFDLFLFANTGDDSEAPWTLDYVETHAKPYAAKHGIELAEVQRRKRDGTTETLLSRLERGNTAVPVRRRKDGPPMSRSCTADFKVRTIAKELKKRGATVTDPAIVAIGISMDEAHRAKPGVDPLSAIQVRTYPLLMADHTDPHSDNLRLRRSDCEAVIRKAGLPVPDKSSCWFCPYHDMDAWRRLKADHADLFAHACRIEADLSASSSDGRPVYLTRSGRPLADTVDSQMTLGLDHCDDGRCMT